MKILRIAGKNLASLGGEFELDFLQEPLVSSGLFAICGPTGAGKSTLLDALCLALYDATPRLARAGSKGVGLPDVRDETVTPQDTRNLLRRGSADGYAEVDFVGNDSRCYRARWSVRRARAKADGALQQVAMSLLTLPEQQAIGGTNREVKAEIENRIGLNFDQFTRAVLLAQNEFSAFLRADDGERGELLETLTGTAIYSDMSRRAFDRAKSEQQTLNAINQRLMDQTPLDPQARLELERDCAEAHDAMMVLEQRKCELEAELRWHNALQEAQRGEEVARKEAERLFSIHQSMDGRRRQLNQLEMVQPARALLEEAARVASAIASIRAELVSIDNQLLCARQNQHEIQTSVSASEQAYKAALKAHENALPNIERAKSLDAQIIALIPENDQVAGVVAQIRTSRAEIAMRLDNGRKAFQDAEQLKQTTEQWLSEHASLQPLADQWPRWDSVLKQSATQLQARNALTRELAEGKMALQRLDAKVRDSDVRLASAIRAHADAEMQRLTCQFESASHSRTALRQERQHLEARRDVIEHGSRVWSVLQGARQQQRSLCADADQLRIEEAESELKSKRLETDIAVSKAALDQAEKAQLTVRIACSDSVENLRDALQDSIPCPVCGSVEHPYAGNSERLHSMLAEFDAETRKCRAKYEETLARQASHRALVYESQRRLQQIGGHLHDAGERLKAAEAEWALHPLSDMAQAQSCEDIESWIAGEILAFRERFQQLSAAEAAADKAAQRLDLAQQAFDAATLSLTEKRSQFDLAVNEARHLKSDIDRLSVRSMEAEDRLAKMLEELSSGLCTPEWINAWRTDPDAFRDDCEKRVAHWMQQHRNLEDAVARMAEKSAAILNLEDALSRCDAELRRAVSTLEESNRRIEEMRFARGALFGSKNISDVEEKLASAISIAKSAFDGDSRRLQECLLIVVRQQETLDQTRQRLSALEVEHADSSERVSDWISKFNAENSDPCGMIDAEKLGALMQKTPAWISSERDELQACFTALQTANAIFQERRDRCAAHQQSRPGVEDAATVRSMLDELTTQFESVRTEFTRKKIALAEDDSRREKSSSLLAELTRQQTNARLWGQLAELIGSADGKKFRNYAQQFTLDVLLGYANRHLQELVRRYRLERVKDTLALLVVDQDMGDEVRSIHSLSGGESFLVSLALALGLASLSSNRVRVESLFIDEGFGSLDADTLSIAMHALDSLQSQGRKVGVITHVQEMSERIATKVMVQRVAGGKSLVRVESESVV